MPIIVFTSAKTCSFVVTATGPATDKPEMEGLAETVADESIAVRTAVDDLVWVDDDGLVAVWVDRLRFAFSVYIATTGRNKPGCRGR